MSSITDFWPKTESIVELVLTDTLPDNPITAVKVFYFKDNRLLLVKIPSGWDIPGGHIEHDETPEQALKREVIEETGGSLSKCKVAGYLKITNQKENEHNKKYPKVSIIGLYTGTIIDYGGEMMHESSDVQMIELSKLKDTLSYWNDFHQYVIKSMHEAAKQINQY